MSSCVIPHVSATECFSICRLLQTHLKKFELLDEAKNTDTRLRLRQSVASACINVLKADMHGYSKITNARERVLA